MKQFKDLSLKGQKMRIVRDAIAQIKIGKIIPDQGTYFVLNDIPDYKDLKKELTKTDNTCDACAKGALFAACVINVNKVKVDDGTNSNYFQVRKLKKWFSEGELDLIETAFEGAVIYDSNNELYTGEEDCWGNPAYTELGQRAIEFGENYDNTEDRLLAILENILKHGTFKP